MKNNKSIFSCIIICCMMMFCTQDVFAQGTIGEYPGAGVGFDAGCGYPDAGNSTPGVSDIGIPGNVCGSAFDATFGPWVETTTGFDISGFELNNYDIDTEASYGIRLFYGPQDGCGTICLDAMIDISQNVACGTFGPQASLASFGYPVPAMYGADIFGNDVIPYDNMCPNTEYFAQYQLIVATDVDLTDPDGDLCAMDQALITGAGTMTTVQTLVAPGTRDPITINAATFTPTAAVDCAADEVVFDLTLDVTSGCMVSFGTLSKGLEVAVRADIACGAAPNVMLDSGPLINDPTACIVGTLNTNEVPDQVANPIQVTLSEDQLCAILACDPNAMLEIYATHAFCEADDINGDGSGVDEAVFPISVATVLAELNNAMCCGVPGCTDPCAPNFDPLADMDDGSCEPYDMTCNADCTAGPFGGTWDAATCACINETTPVNGCTDPMANNFDAAANCDDGSCMFDTPGCTDPCAPNFDPMADMDDGSCEAYDMTCNADCTAGPFGGTWDAATCACINETAPVSGCTDPAANNFDPAANCDDGSCTNAVPGCTDACAPNFDPLATTDDGSCEAYDDTCNADCTAGPFGGTWDAATCACINETTPVSGCTDPAADNFDPAANCDDGSCMTAPMCSISAIVTSTCDQNGTPEDGSDDITTYTITVSGSNTGAGFTASVAPDSGALTYDTPLTYTVTGTGGLSVTFTDDADTTCTAVVNESSGCGTVSNVPTVGEWGLIILGLLMSIAAIVGIRARREEEAIA